MIKNSIKETVLAGGEKVCLRCHNHCSVDQLHCSKGKEDFGLPTDKNARHNNGEKPLDEKDMTLDEIVLALMRQCGHFLHHNIEHKENIDTLKLDFYTEQEKRELIQLLKICLNKWRAL